MKLSSVELFVPAPNDVSGIFGRAFYTQVSGLEMISIHFIQTLSDILNVGYHRWSSDNGRTWTEPVEVPVCCEADGKAFRTVFGHDGPAAVFHPDTGEMLLLGYQEVAPDNRTQATECRLVRLTSNDGLRTTSGQGYVVPNAGSPTSGPVFWDERTILYPAQKCRTGPDGNPWAPHGFALNDAALLIGRWQDEGITWERSEGIIEPDPRGAPRA